MVESFYNTLGINEKASKEEIKKAFRGLSMKWHPDKNLGNPEAVGMFQKINEAYETLGNEEKRQEYDMMNSNPFFSMNHGNPNASQMEKNMDEFLNSFMGNMAFFHSQPFGPGGPSFGPRGAMPSFQGMPGGPRIRVYQGGNPMGFQQAIQKPSPIIKNITINIDQILNGSKVPLDIERWIVDNGTKIFETETIYVDIPQGVDENEIIIIRNKGNAMNDECKGDVKIFVKIENKTDFKRFGLDLILEKDISLKEALCGFSFELKFLNGKSYTLNNNSGNIIEPEYKKIVQGMGLKRENHTGNLIIHFHIKFPEKLTEEQITQLKLIL